MKDIKLTDLLPICVVSLQYTASQFILDITTNIDTLQFTKNIRLGLMKLIGYVRVSEIRAGESLSLRLQTEKIKVYCNLNDYTLVEIIEDAGVSAKISLEEKGFKRF